MKHFTHVATRTDARAPRSDGSVCRAGSSSRRRRPRLHQQRRSQPAPSQTGRRQATPSTATSSRSIRREHVGGPADTFSIVLNSLQVGRATRVAGEAPISDVANSLMVTRSARNAAKESTPSSAVLASDYSSFNWSDATIGAAATLGFVLLAGAAALVNLRRRPVREEHTSRRRRCDVTTRELVTSHRRLPVWGCRPRVPAGSTTARGGIR